jgi:hypothetical protein
VGKLVFGSARTEAGIRGQATMNIRQSPSISSDELRIKRDDLQRRMAEIVALREKVASLDKVRKKKRWPRHESERPSDVERTLGSGR